MPFPLAHPAAVLPLKQMCPRWLNLPALVIGTLVPDAAYLFGKLKAEEISHSIFGIVVFCLPVGLALTWLFCWIGPKFAARKPEKHAVVPSVFGCANGVPWLRAAVSVVIGAATHLAWDAFTHSGGAAAEQIPLLNHSIGSFAGHNVRVCRALWYLSSFIGVAWVFLTLRMGQKDMRPAEESNGIPAYDPMKRGSGGMRFVEAFIVAALVLPIELLHDLVRGPIGLLLVGMLTLLVVVVVVWILARGSGPGAVVSKQTGPAS